MEAEQLRARQDWSSCQPDVYHLFEPVIILRILLGDILRLIDYELFRYSWQIGLNIRHNEEYLDTVDTAWYDSKRFSFTSALQGDRGHVLAHVA